MSVSTSRMMDILLNLAAETEPVRGSRHAAAITKNREIISIGSNLYRTDPFMAKYSEDFNKEAIYIHAELSAIKQATRIISTDDFKKCSLYVVRAKFDKKGNLETGLSKPCESCYAAIVDFDIPAVHYTTEDREWATL